MIIKIALILITYFCLVHGFPHDIASQQPESAKVLTLIQRIMAKREEYIADVKYEGTVAFAENKCLVGQVWNTYEKNCQNGVTPYSYSKINNAFDYDYPNDYVQQR
jgi:hypothetical protein